MSVAEASIPPQSTGGRKAKQAMASVQAAYVRVREVRQNVLCLAPTRVGARRDYCTVLKVDGTNYFLKGEEDQQAINEAFHLFLAGLSHPVQILIRVLPLDLVPYLSHFQPDGENPRGTATNDIWDELASSHIQFLQRLGSQRTLLERHFYIVIPADLLQSEQRRSVLQSALSSLSPKKRRECSLHEEYDRARQQLDLRCSEVVRQLGHMGLRAQRLSKVDLVRLEYSCLTSDRAARYPLLEQVIECIDRVVQVHPEHVVRDFVRRAPTISQNQLAQIYAAAEAEEERRRQASHKKRRAGKIAPQVEHPLDFAQLTDLVAPASVTLQETSLCVEGEYVRTIAVRQLPRFVPTGWLRPLAELDEPMEISFHLRPRNSGAMILQLRRRQMEYESSTSLARGKGRLVDPDMQVAQGDVQSLIERLASGEERMLDFSMHVLLRGQSRRALGERTDRVMAVLQNMLLVARTATYEQDKGFRSCLPHARTELGRGLLIDSGSAATAFPFLSTSLFAAEGILEGITPAGEPVVLDWWSPEQRNANRLVVAPSGSGKSFKTKLDMIRMYLMYGRGGAKNRAGYPPGHMSYQTICIDPEREYRRLCTALSGQWIRLAPGSMHRINPFDLPRDNASSSWNFGQGEQLHGDLLADHIQKLQALLDIMLADRTPTGAGTLSSQEKGLLDRALYETYRQVGITADPRTHQRPAPLLRDLYMVLESGICGPDVTGLVPRLRRFVRGSLSGMFDGPTNVELNNALVVMDVHDLDSELRPIAFFLISNHVWSASFGSTIPRQLVVDELLSLYQYPEGARFLETLFQRGRKHFLGVTGITQHPTLLIDSTIPSNCSVQILMAQEPASLDLVTQVFKLSPRETQIVKACGKGDALLLTGEKRIFVHFEASEQEYRLASTDPRDLARWQREEELQSQNRQPWPLSDERYAQRPDVASPSVRWNGEHTHQPLPDPAAVQRNSEDTRMVPPPTTVPAIARWEGARNGEAQGEVKARRDTPGSSLLSRDWSTWSSHDQARSAEPEAEKPTHSRSPTTGPIPPEFWRRADPLQERSPLAPHLPQGSGEMRSPVPHSSPIVMVLTGSGAQATTQGDLEQYREDVPHSHAGERSVS